MSDVEKNVLDLFKSLVVVETTGLNYDYINRGFVTNFNPSPAQLTLLGSAFKPLNMRTLFSVEERENADLEHLLTKQFLHYVEVYGLGVPGLFNLEFDGGKVVSVNYVTGITVEELNEKVQTLLYSNAPVKNAVAIKEIIDHYGISYDVNKIKNNELRVVLFNVSTDVFSDGDDTVRYMCYRATKSAMLIKSPEVIAAIKATVFDKKFFENHAVPLARVFNRHKNLILAAKNKSNAGAINKIGRMSKNLHVPIHEPLSKRFISTALRGEITDFSVLNKMSIRDKFKFLNVLSYKRQRNTMDAFIIRNGKIHIEEGRAVFSDKYISYIEREVLNSIALDLKHLNGQKIVLDQNIDYGLPISRKQTLGNLPFGTAAYCDGIDISSGIYWHNKDGAYDIDLSAIDDAGQRTGWGQYSGYDKKNPITYSGDLTSAHNGAMEFMTSSTQYTEPYGLFANIFTGEIGAKAKIVVGSKTKAHWIENPVLNEEIVLDSKNMFFGFVRGDKFIIYSGRMSNGRVSGSNKDKAIISRGLTDFWTVRKLFDAINIEYTVDIQDDVEYNHNLSYGGFSYNKLEKMFNIA